METLSMQEVRAAGSVTAADRRRLWPAILWAGVSAISFHLAYTFPSLAFLMAIFLYGLARLTDLPSLRWSFYAGLLTALACYVPQTLFLARIFHLFAVPLWILLALWAGLFV